MSLGEADYAQFKFLASSDFWKNYFKALSLLFFFRAVGVGGGRVCSTNKACMKHPPSDQSDCGPSCITF